MAHMRPTINGSLVTTPETATTIQLLGATRLGPIALSHDQTRAIHRLYGFTPELPNQKPPPPPPPERASFDQRWKYEEALKKHQEALERHARWEDPRPLMQAGADRNALRHAEADGFRILAWLAEFIPAGEDPLRHVIQWAIDAGLDVSTEDVDWALNSEDEGDLEG